AEPLRPPNALRPKANPTPPRAVWAAGPAAWAPRPGVGASATKRCTPGPLVARTLRRSARYVRMRLHSGRFDPGENAAAGDASLGKLSCLSRPLVCPHRTRPARWGLPDAYLQPTIH